MRAHNQGLSVIQVVIVVVVIGVLVALIIPAIQIARASARMAQCKHNMNQLSAAMRKHEQAQGFFPSGGWGARWVGDADSGFDKHQPGGFFYNILPYLDRQELHDLAAGTARGSDKQNDLNLQAAQTIVPVMTCPTRRAPMVRPTPINPKEMCNCSSPSDPSMSAWFNGDYKANAGSVVVGWWTGPTSWEEAEKWIDEPLDTPKNPFLDMSKSNGICHQQSQVRADDVADGLANTYLLGEKCIDPVYYADFTDGNDCNGDQPAIGADTLDLVGWTNTSPTPDRPNKPNWRGFGSAHASGLNMSFCDGSVRTISYQIDRKIHRNLGNRKDGQKTDASNL